MDKMKMETPDLTNQNIGKIGSLFPNCITETVNKDGKLKKAINFEMLRQMLSEDVVDGDEAYEFTWVGKKASIVEANKPIRKTLRPCKEESKDWDSTENLYIEGDNLEVLKLLQESYLGKVKLIYIDPPYNTGNDFIYRDNFTQSNSEYEEKMGVLDDKDNRLYKNSDSNGRFHSDWCSMMYARLMLGRNLLADDGVIFISIDEKEQDNLKKICDEIFGEENFLSQIAWKRKKEISNDSNNIAIQGEYILCYGKAMTKLKFEPLSEDYVQKSYNEPTKDFSLGKWRPVPLTVSKGLSGGGYTYTITTPTGKQHTRLWAYPEEGYLKLCDEHRVYFGKDNNGIPQRVMYLNESKGQPISNYWDDVATNKEGKKDILSIFGDNCFDTPKPIKLIEKMLRVVVDENDIILDFFSGSATTAHAIIDFNAKNNRKNKFIMVQLPEPCAERSTAKQNGWESICEIGKERIRRAGDKIKAENPDTTENLDIGFRVLKLDDSNMKDVYYSADEYNQNLLDRMESNIKEDRTDLDLLFGCLLDWGIPLSFPYSSEIIEGCTVHNYNDGDLIACFDEAIPDSVVKTIAKKQPHRAVFRDSGFVNSPSKINVGEVFKMLSPDTRVKIL